MSPERAFHEMNRLFDEASEELCEYQSLMIDLYRETKDKRIEALFRKGGGIMLDGEYRFHKNDPTNEEK